MVDTKRDTEIIQMRKDGLSCKQIGERFGISPGRVGQIISAFEMEEQQRERFDQILQTLRSTNNLDKKWPKEFLMEFLLLPKVLAWRLERYFRRENIVELSLRDLMDFLISAHIELGQDVFQVMPALTQFNIGRKTHTWLVGRVSQQDLGEAFNKEWAMRIVNAVRTLQKTNAYIPSVLKDVARLLGPTNKDRS